MHAPELIAKALKTLKYEDDRENLPNILADLICAVVQLARANGYPLHLVSDVLDEAWRQTGKDEQES